MGKPIIKNSFVQKELSDNTTAPINIELRLLAYNIAKESEAKHNASVTRVPYENGYVEVPKKLLLSTGKVILDNRTDALKQSQELAGEYMREKELIKNNIENGDKIMSHSTDYVPFIGSLFRGGQGQLMRAYNIPGYLLVLNNAAISGVIDLGLLGLFGNIGVKPLIGSWIGGEGGRYIGELYDSPYLGLLIGSVVGGSSLPFLNRVGQISYNAVKPSILGYKLSRMPLGEVETPDLAPKMRYRSGDVEINDPNLNYRLGSTNIVKDFLNSRKVRVDYPNTENVNLVETNVGTFDFGKTFDNPMFKLGGLWYDGDIVNGIDASHPGLLVTREPLQFATKNARVAKRDMSGRRIPFSEDLLNLENTSAYIWEPNYGFRRVVSNTPKANYSFYQRPSNLTEAEKQESLNLIFGKELDEVIKNTPSGEILKMEIDLPYTSSIIKEISNITGIDTDNLLFASSEELTELAKKYPKLNEIVSKAKEAMMKVGIFSGGMYLLNNQQKQ